MPSPKPAKRHHFVPAFLLAGFTQSCEKTGELWVTDFENGNQFARSPLTTGFERNFHTVDVQGLEPDVLETDVLAKIEQRCAPIIKDVLTKRIVPAGQEYVDLISFIALMMVRTPKARRIGEEGIGSLYKFQLRQVVKTEQRWEAAKAEMRQGGIDFDDSVSYAQMKSFSDRDQFKCRVDQNWLLGTMMETAVAMMPTLIHRSWSILCSPEGGIICSDHPATCSFVERVPAMWSPAPGLPHTEVQLPLSRNLLLVGSLEGPPLTGNLNRKGVAFYNSRTLLQAERFVYSTEQDFMWLGRDHTIKRRPDELVAARNKSADSDPPDIRK